MTDAHTWKGFSIHICFDTENSTIRVRLYLLGVREGWEWVNWVQLRTQRQRERERRRDRDRDRGGLVVWWAPEIDRTSANSAGTCTLPFSAKSLSFVTNVLLFVLPLYFFIFFPLRVVCLSIYHFPFFLCETLIKIEIKN